MSKAVSLGALRRHRIAVEPMLLALVVAGGFGAYSFRNAINVPPARPVAAKVPHYAMAVSIRDEGRRPATLQPARAAAAVSEVAALTPPRTGESASFTSAFRPLTHTTAVRRNLLHLAAPAAQADNGASAAVEEPASVAAPAPAPAIEVAPAVPVIAPVPVIPAAVPVPAAPVVEPAPIAAVAPVMVQAAAVVQEAPALAIEPVLTPEPVPAQTTSLAVAAPTVPAALAKGPTTDAGPVARSLVAPVLIAPAAPRPKSLAAARPAAPKAAFVAPATQRPLTKVAPSRTKRAAVIAGPQIPSRYKLIDGGLETTIGAQLYGQPLGTIPLRITGSGQPALRLADLLALLKDRMDTARYERLAASSAAGEFVGFDTLRGAGIPVRYDATNDRLVLGEE